ncbi:MULTISPECIES: phage/plasmid primase, P4 family [unclassified Bradyrhizobium]|uniref:DNA primase family protein n=1 Tax=unclassified Bradyrhizobium TaxID=2631580 RepID=UPI0028EBD3A5|nr:MULTISPECIES: phage/plasmid primase, P4 family [unclassified Bradyrhizobium]
MMDHEDDVPPHERIVRLIEGDDDTDISGFAAYAPHPAGGGFPEGQGEDDVEPADNERPADAAEISRDVLIACAAEPQNDTGNGQRLLHHFGADLLHVRNVGWHAWAGTHWEREGGNELATRLAHKTAARIVLEADVMAATPNEQAAIDAANQARDQLAAIEREKGAEARKDQRWQMLTRLVERGTEARAALLARQIARRKYSVSSGNAGKIRGMLDQALPYRTVTVDELDADGLAFNVLNGTIRFRCTEEPDPDAHDHEHKTVKRWCVELTPHERTDHITKVAPVEYVEGARCPRFLAAVNRFLPIEPVRNFVQRYHGYALTGLTGEQCFVFSYGTGANWKSTFVEIVARIMGPYCATIAFESLSGDQQRSGSQATPDLARLPGARLVRASEPERGVQFKEALIKSLTGGEPMLVRSLNKEFFEFRPAFKMVLSGNHKPEVSGVDHGIWRRIKFVPWPVTIADHERRPMDEVMGEIWPERSGILNWLIAGALDYLNGGLHTPAEVNDATAEYRDEMDPIGMFAGACIESVPANPDGSPASSVAARDMFAAFSAWAAANAVRAWKETMFGRAMGQKGFVKDRKSSNIRYLHVRLKNVPAAPHRNHDGAPPHPGDDDIAPV